MVRHFYNSVQACLFYAFILLGCALHANAEEPGREGPKATTSKATLLKSSLPADQQRYLLYVFYNNGYANDPNFNWTSIETAIKNGCNGVELCVPWSEIYPTRNGPAYWATLDKQIDRIIQLGAKVALRIGLHRDLDRVDTYWTEDNGVHNYRNELQYRAHARMFSLAHQPTLNLAVDFVAQVAQRYSNQQQQGNILFMAVTNTPLLESEYIFEREVLYQADLTSTVTDYSTAMITGFRTWLTTKYTTVSALNTAWGSNYSSFNAIQPSGFLEASVYTAFVGKRGKDWYAYRHKVHKNFVDQTTSVIKAANSSYKVVNGHGSIFDGGSVFRGTLAFNNYAQNADGVKVDNAPFYPHRFTMDLVRSNIGAGKWVMNEVSGDVIYDMNVYANWINQSFQHGAKAITLANFNGDAGLEAVRQICQQTWAQGWKDNPIPEFKPVGTISVKLSQLVDSGYDGLGIPGQWNQTYNQNGNQPVRITLDNDILDDTPIVTTPPASTTTAPTTPSNSLALLAPTVDCSTGILTFKTSGGDGTPIEFRAVGLKDWSTVATASLVSYQRTGVTFTLQARQSGIVVTYNFTTNCSASANLPPVLVSPVAAQTMTTGTPYSVVIPTTTFSDSDGFIASWAVTQLPPGLTYAAATRTISGTATTAGSTSALLTVTDNQGATAQQLIPFLVTAPTLPTTPTTSTTATTPTALSMVTPAYDCAAGKLIFRTKGGDGTSIEYMALGIMGWSKDSVAVLDAWLRTGVTFTLQARQSGKVVTATYTPNCATNKPPVVVTPIANQTATLGRAYSFVVPTSTFSDPDGQVVSWAAANLPVGLIFEAVTHTISGTPSLIGPNVVSVTVTDNNGASVQTTFVLQILGTNTTPVTPSGPALLSLLAPTLDCTTGRFVFRSTGGDGTSIEYFAVGIKSWSKDSVAILDAWLRTGVTFTLQARQNGKVVTAGYMSNCSTTPVPPATPTPPTTPVPPTPPTPPDNKPPVVVTAIANQTATLGRAYSFVVPTSTFSDPDGQVVSWAAANLPVGLIFEAATHTISGTPSLIGPNVVSVTVTDNNGASVQTTFVLQILGTNTTPVTPSGPALLSLLAPTLDCTTGRFVFRSTGGDGTSIEYFAVGIKSWGTDSVGFVDPWQRTGINL